jgi:hypothetical protein
MCASPCELVEEVVGAFPAVYNQLQEGQGPASQLHLAQAIHVLQELAQPVRLPMRTATTAVFSKSVNISTLVLLRVQIHKLAA